MRRQPLERWDFRHGFVAADKFVAAGLDALAPGSRNLLLLGAVTLGGELAPALMRPWQGLQSKGASTGSRKMVAVGKTWGGIKDVGGTQGAGSLFEDFGRSLWMIGAGQPHIAGADLTGITLSTSLKVAIAVAGAYSAATTYTAGLPQPSAPDVAIVATPGAGFTGTVNGAVSVKIARVRSATGGRSRASTTSAVIVPANQSFSVVFPAASSGQDVWRVFVTQQGFGGVGLHLALPRNGSLDVLESDVAAASGRLLEFEYKDGDLVPETAWVDDFAPPAGTHAARVGQSMCVLGAYGDSSSAVSSTSTGTMTAVSLPNFYESYRPADLVAHAEQIVDVLSREAEDYSFVTHKNSVTSLQFVGFRDDGPAVVSVPVWPDVGFQYPHNVCQFFGRLAGIVGKGSFVMMGADGKPDFSWGAEIREAVKDWTPAATAVGFHPDNLSLVVMNGGEAYSYSLENKKWSPAAYAADAGAAGSYLACVASQGELVVSLNNAGAHTAYKFDAGASSMPVSAVTNWRRPGGGRAVSVSEISADFECDSAAAPLFLGVHANLRRTYLRDLATTSGTPIVTSASSPFDAEHAGDLMLVFGANVGGAGVNHLLGRLTYSSPGICLLSDPASGAPLNAQATLSNCHAVVANDLAAFQPPRAGAQHTGPLEDVLARDLLSVSLSAHMLAQTAGARVTELSCAGTGGGEPVSRTA